MKRDRQFHGDQKLPMNSLLASVEKKFVNALAPKFPAWIEGYHLTLMTILWSIGLIGFGWPAQKNPHWLWLSSLMIFLQWFTDSFDGALGRLRDTGIPKWGYYMDHFLDYIFLCAILIGYSFLLELRNVPLLYGLLLIFTGFMVNAFLSFAATNEFKITYLRFGPTEMRIFFIGVNTYIIFFGVAVLENALKYLIPVSLVLLVFIVFRTQNYVWSIDMQDKAARKKLTT